MRARNIKPGFFVNEDLAECSAFARLCFIGLWMLADREGRLEDRPKRINGELFTFDDVDIDALLDELVVHRFIVRYRVGRLRFIQVLKFSENQSPHYAEKASVIPAPPLELLHDEADAEAKSRFQPEAQPQSETQADTQASDLLTSDSGFLTADSPSPNGEGLSPAGAGDPPEPDPEDPPNPKPKTNGANGRIPDCPHLKLLELWHQVLPELPQHKPALWKGERADHLRARWREAAHEHHWTSEADGLAYFERLFHWVRDSRFLMGRAPPPPGRRPFELELAWLVTPQPWAKVIEGKYHQ